MKKHLILLLAFAILSMWKITAQSCLPGGITFSTQGQIDSFQINYPGCMEIEGDVIISGDDITNLSGLSALSSITGDLRVESNNGLSSLIGLDSLHYIEGPLDVTNNASLTNLSGLENLDTIIGCINIINNSVLNSLSGLEALSYVGVCSFTGGFFRGINIEGNPSLIDLSQLQNFSSLSKLQIVNNDALTSLSGLENIDSVNGKCVIHLDKSFYVSGEIIWYKIYFPAEFKGHSFIAKVNIINKEAGFAESYFIKSEGEAHVNGYYKIPYGIKSGIYQFSFEVGDKGSRQTSTLLSVWVPIYNDLEEPDNLPSTGKAKPAHISPPIDNELSISIELGKEHFQNREGINPIIRVKDNSGKAVKANISVSVTDWKLTKSGISHYEQIMAGNPVAPGIRIWADGAIFLKGKFLDDMAEAIQANIVGIYSGSENRMYYTKSNAEGNFFFNLPDFYGSKNLQFMGHQLEMESINVKLDIQESANADYSLQLNEEILNYLTLSRQRKKVSHYFEVMESEINPETVINDVQKLSPDFSYDIEKYEHFENIFAFFRELKTALRFQVDKNGAVSANLYNPQRIKKDNFFPGKPLFIIDDKITLDADFAGKISTDQVVRVDLFFNPQKLQKQFKIMGKNGVVRISTKLSGISLPESEEEDIFTINGLLPKAAFPVFDPGNTAKALPFFRPQLYWDPLLKTDENGKATFSYFQSDDISTFEITVVAQTDDGKIGFAKKKYEVAIR